MAKKRETVKIPEDWKGAFRGATMRTTFALHLSQAMIEFLCAVADQVEWDRMLYFQNGSVHRPDCFITSSRALEKRGLIYVDDAARVEFRNHVNGRAWEESCTHTQYRLTPAGAALVELLKVTGIFVEADAAIIKKAKRA